MPPFGRDTVQKIIYNVSELKQLAARDFEDILQCAIPAFEGLFPESIDNKIQELLFVLGDWHSLAEHGASKDKPYSLDRYKLHTLSEYPSQIRLFRSLDVISTQLVRAQHVVY
ncbi:hypothetical protein M407DRAFT_84985 [Tulasnella calospora MUT 4182]|uniref:Uncharacterized protein n=1 Tax=Tulasnella calospora MUT 4182 TaxID=1051891 RepID=A0A0C3L7H0_9AGAM|nr:hypothetical protein M407DRAFT_84985 [Tulasnella calospora MUT 4182]